MSQQRGSGFHCHASTRMASVFSIRKHEQSRTEKSGERAQFKNFWPVASTTKIESSHIALQESHLGKTTRSQAATKPYRSNFFRSVQHIGGFDAATRCRTVAARELRALARNQ